MSNKIKHFILLDKQNVCTIQLQTTRLRDLGHQLQQVKQTKVSRMEKLLPFHWSKLFIQIHFSPFPFAWVWWFFFFLLSFQVVGTYVMAMLILGDLLLLCLDWFLKYLFFKIIYLKINWGVWHLFKITFWKA